MIRTLALLGLFASSPILGFTFNLFAESKLLTENLSYRFDVVDGFHLLPRTVEEAEKANWTQVENPVKSSGFAELTLWIKKDQLCNLIGLYFDENNQVGGLHINQPLDSINSFYDLKEQGLTIWNHNSVDYAYIPMFWVSEDKQTRIDSYDPTKLIRNEYLTVAGFNGVLDKIPANCQNLDSIWTKQACIPMMGLHYYYNMTQSLTCDTCFYPWFPLCDKSTLQFIGLGFMYLGLSECNMEQPSTAAVKMIVPNGPQCLYDLVEENSASTLHIYLVDRPQTIGC